VPEVRAPFGENRAGGGAALEEVGWYVTDYAGKSTDGGSKESKPAAETKESVGKDAGAKDSKDGGSKEASAKDSSAKETSSKESSPKEKKPAKKK
jgi:hypothetical protein